MADVTRVVQTIIFLCYIYVARSTIDGKALYCKDPDTGKLHSINTTWPSASFCGNYSCKLKKRNITEIEYMPVAQDNRSTIDTGDNKIESNSNLKEEATPVSREDKKESDTQPLLHSNTNHEPKNWQNEDPNNDRYLTESEIKSISEVLHTVKKSDLDAIVEIYNLAQDIYQEVDKETSSNKTESIDVVKDNKSEPNEMKTLPNPKSTSYWYEPLNINTQKAARSIDMDHQGSDSLRSAIAYKSEPKQSYYSNTLLSKLPYYYPLSNFQRMPSYIDQIPTPKPCSQANEHTLINTVLKKQEQRLIQPSILLPYPFSYVHNYNISYLNDYLYNPNVWSYYDYYKHRNYHPYAYISQLPSNTVVSNTQTNTQDAESNSVSKEENDILDDLIAKAKMTKLPDWKTAPLTDHVLEEVRANIEKTSLLPLRLPLLKKINLEKVGKLIKLDGLPRSKRDTNGKYDEETIKDDTGLYESFIETITCPPDTQVGYFRRGNLSKTYPECCPQRIDKPFVSTNSTKNHLKNDTDKID